jgi:hypothetical protein
MLSGETAIGAYPVESVTTMKQVASAAEQYLGTTHISRSFFPPTLPPIGSMPRSQPGGESARSMPE